MQHDLLRANETLTEVINISLATITNPHWKLFVSLVSTSLVFLFITLILYILVWEKHNWKGWTQFSYLLALFLFDSVFVVALCPGLNTGADRNPICKTLSILNQYFFVCAKTWLIIISFDLYFTIRNMRISDSGTSKNFFRFIIYSSIGWTLPLVFVTLGIILNLQHKHNLPTKSEANNVDNLWTSFPDYGFQHCRIPTWFVWQSFVFGNCIFHFFMFGLISITILCQRRRIASLADISSNSNTNRPSPFLMLLRLFIVVGLSWSYIALQDITRAGNINTQQTWGWHVFRCFFFLQGVFISVITITNGKTMSNLVAKYPKLKGVQKVLRLNVISQIRQRFCMQSRKESLRSCISQRTVDSIVV